LSTIPHCENPTGPRWLTLPIPREPNPEISAELQEIIYRAVERGPENRYSSARAFAEDLAHPEKVEIIDHSAQGDRKPKSAPIAKRILSHAMLAPISTVILKLLLILARLK